MRTDLALEENERYAGQNVEVSGVSIDERYVCCGSIKITNVKIFSKKGERAMRKPQGTYITMECSGIGSGPDKRSDITGQLSEELKKLLAKKRCRTALVAGVGNREATADALGPIAAASVLAGERVCVIAPGVMSQTGMETSELIAAVAGSRKPDVIIVVDALAARSVKRLGCTIQISDTGIVPGSGVGNCRQEISEKTMGVPVIAIGVPTVVDAATIVGDVMKTIPDKIDIKNLMDSELAAMYVTPKDIDENVKNVARIISDAINYALGA